MGFNDALTFPSLQLESPRMSPRSQSPRVKRRPRTESTGNKNKKIGTVFKNQRKSLI